jgi:hypothetical protein
MTDITLEVGLSEEKVTAIRAELEEKGKADFTLEFGLTDANGEVVSIVQGVWQGRKMTPELAALMSQVSL